MAVVAATWATLLLLILTTPPDAIRLPIRRSVFWVTGLTAWTWAVQAACFERHRPAVIAAVAAAPVALGLASALARCRRTPWWAGVLLWSPATLGPVAWPLPLSVVVAAVAILVARTFAEPRRLADGDAAG